MVDDVIMNDQTEQKDTIELKKNAIAMEFKKSLSEIDKAVTLKDIKSLSMNFRQMNKFREEFSEEVFTSLYDLYIKSAYKFPTFKLDPNQLPLNTLNIQPKLLAKTKELPEVFGYVFLIIVLKLIDQKQYEEAFKGIEFLLNYFKTNESLTTQYLRAKAYYYYSLIAEKIGNVDVIIKELHFAYRQACLGMDEISQVTLINCIVRYYLNNNAVEQARNFLSKTKYHENVSTNEDARYLFYTGRIEAIQMNYSDAYKHLSNSLRKAPEKCGQGFRNVVNKLILIVQLLMGEIPDIKAILSQIIDFHSFKPYLDLLKVVKHGNLEEFKIVLQKYEKEFENDKNFTLIQRIRHVVIKAGLRKINLSYSRISIKDIAEKLKLDGDKEAEYVIAKAIRDGVFLAKINHEEGYVQSMDMKDIYSTFEPQKSYISRIEFMNKIYNDCHQAMKYSEKQDDAKKAQKSTELEEADIVDQGLEDF